MGVEMDGMVTARMPEGKKKAGAAVLAELGVTASQAINGLYDFMLEHGKLPFDRDSNRGAADAQALKKAIEWADSVVLPPDNRFTEMSDDDIRRERLVSKGLM